MPDYFFDTSALGKNYHNEVGTSKAEQLLKEPAARHFISRLSVIEIQSVFAGKVRAGVISETDFRTLRRRFWASRGFGSADRYQPRDSVDIA